MIENTNRPVVLSVLGSFPGQIRSQVEAVQGEHCFLPESVRTDTALRDWYELADAVLLCGGTDIDPSYYGQKRTHAVGRDDYRDWSENLLASWALADGKPLMGICRGHQMIAVTAGVGLWQDMNKTIKQCKHNNWSSHRVVLEHRRTQSFFGGNEVGWVNSYHHQAVDNVPDGFELGALSTDGIIESLINQHTLTMQWHPEAMGNDGLPPFRWLVGKARKWGRAMGNFYSRSVIAAAIYTEPKYPARKVWKPAKPTAPAAVNSATNNTVTAGTQKALPAFNEGSATGSGPFSSVEPAPVKPGQDPFKDCELTGELVTTAVLKAASYGHYILADEFRPTISYPGGYAANCRTCGQLFCIDTTAEPGDHFWGNASRDKCREPRTGLKSQHRARRRAAGKDVPQPQVKKLKSIQARSFMLGARAALRGEERLCPIVRVAPVKEYRAWWLLGYDLQMQDIKGGWVKPEDDDKRPTVDPRDVLVGSGPALLEAVRANDELDGEREAEQNQESAQIRLRV